MFIFLQERAFVKITRKLFNIAIMQLKSGSSCRARYYFMDNYAGKEAAA